MQPSYGPDLLAGDWCDNARLVPRDCAIWFDANGMAAFNTNPEVENTDDIANGVCLRADVHRLLDKHSLVFYPLGNDFIAHFLQVTPPYDQLYHRVPISVHPRVSIQFLYARFAINIISRVVHNR